MIRETLGEGSKNAFMAITPDNGTSFQYRENTDGSTSHSGWNSGPVVPYWVRLIRSGNTFSGHISSDGISWSLVQSKSIPMSASIYVGLAVSSGDSNLSSVVFKNVTVGGEVLQRGWSVSTGGLLQTELESGIIQGDGAAVSIEQSIDLPEGEYIVTPTRTDNSGGIKIKFDEPVTWDDGSSDEKWINPGESEGFVIESTALPTKITLDTGHGSRKVDSLSILPTKFPIGWTVWSGTLNQTKLANGIIKGSGGHVTIQQTFSQNIASGANLVIRVTSDDDIKLTPLKENGQADNSNPVTILGSVGFAEYTTQTSVSGFKITTVNSTREFSAVSIFQGTVSGGSVQTYAGGGIEKISGIGGYNAGASSMQFIDGNSDGYVQFQIAQNNRPIRIGLVYEDLDYETTLPYGLSFGGNGMIDLTSPFQNDFISYAAEDWFRIRHYAGSNEIKFQKKQTLGYNLVGNWYDGGSGLYSDITTSSLPGMTYHVDEDSGFATYYIKILEDGTFELYDSDAETVLYSPGTYNPSQKKISWNSGPAWEFQDTNDPEDLGEDYITFYTSGITTTGEDLFIDTSFHSVGGRLNDVQIVR